MQMIKIEYIDNTKPNTFFIDKYIEKCKKRVNDFIYDCFVELGYRGRYHNLEAIKGFQKYHNVEVARITSYEFDVGEIISVSCAKKKYYKTLSFRLFK